jgi:hypothetical protein
MVEIGGRPILWHIMKGYAHHGFREFVLALGYRGEIIKVYFLNYACPSSSFSVDLRAGRLETHEGSREDWGALACAGTALAAVWVWDPRWRAVALVPVVQFAAQSVFHATARYGLVALPSALVLVIWTAQRRPRWLGLGALAAAGFLWQVHVWDLLDPALPVIEGW